MRVDRTARRAALLIIAVTSGLMARTAHASEARTGQSQIGRTWPIAEPDALSEIEAKSATLPPDMSKAFGPRRDWSALKAASLGAASADRTRTVIPFYTLEFDITLPNGKLLYPKGFSFNPLTYVKLPQRLVIVHARDLRWALGVARPGDFILLAALGGDTGDAIALSEKANRAIFILEDRVKARLGVTVAPVIVSQVGTALSLSEYGPRSRTVRQEGRP